jgi:peptidoglycan/LPS O-acetylase OafA/YrhL
VTAAEQKRGTHIGPLDGLRTLAILLVLLYHLTPGRDPDQGLRSLLFKIADAGWTGVDLFLVLSGFLITGKLLAARNDEHRFRDFYLRRVLRIFPLYYVALIAAFVIERPPFRAQLPFWTYTANLWQPPLGLKIIDVGHLWSLALEEQFYLLWPFAILLLSRKTAMRICVVMLAVAVGTRYALASSGAGWFPTFAWTPCRVDGLAVGSWLALWMAGRNAGQTGVSVPQKFGTEKPILDVGQTLLSVRSRLYSHAVLLATAIPLAWMVWRGKTGLVFVASDVGFRTILPLLFSLFYGALLVSVLDIRILGAKPFQLGARYSYGIYIVHLLFYPLLLGVIPYRGLAFFLIVTALSTVMAVLSYHGFERYFLRMKPGTMRR